LDTIPHRDAFDRVRDQIGFCGLWCGSCAVGNGCLAELAAGLRQLLADYGVPEWAFVEIGWQELLDALASLKKVTSCAGCRKGGGRNNCEIRACAVGRGVEHCTSCSSFGSCDHAAILGRMRSGATRIGMSVLLPGDDPDTLLPQWTRLVMSRRPSCLLFAEGA
jgi:hypothetical protein